MTPQEQQMIDGLISRIRSTPVDNKDVDAEQRLQQGLSGSPNALYVLAQTVLVQQYGLQQAQAKLKDLQDQNGALQAQLQQTAAQAKSASGGFLSHIFGSSAPQSTTGQQPPYQPVNNPGYAAQGYPGGGYPPPPPYPPQGSPAPTSGGFGGGGGFLQGALQTAAGVAAGEMAFQGMESLFHGFEHGGSGGYERGLAGGAPGETVVNNYYDDNGDRSDTGDRDRSDAGDRDGGNFYNPDRDASRDDGDSARFADTNDGNNGQDFLSSNDGSSNDDSNFADSSSDDASFDDSGNDDSSGDGSGF